MILKPNHARSLFVKIYKTQALSLSNETRARLINNLQTRARPDLSIKPKHDAYFVKQNLTNHSLAHFNLKRQNYINNPCT